MPPLTVADHPLICHKLTLLRDRETPAPTFRQLLRELGQLLICEATRDLPTAERCVETPLQPTQAPLLAGRKPAVISILRAGNGLLDGALDLIPFARVGFVGLYRDETTLQPVQYYFKVPGALQARVVFVVDPMLATGNSAAAAVSLLKQAGARDIRFLCVLAAPEGVARMHDAHKDVPIIAAALDERLNEAGYILPGLGDAGDRMYGTGSAAVAETG